MGQHQRAAAGLIGALLRSAPFLAGVGAVVGLIVAWFMLPLNSPSRPAFPDLGLASPAPDRAAPAGPVRPTPARSSPVTGPTGEYALAERYDRVFIAAVVIGNESGQDSDWTVELGFGGDVGELSAFWVEGAIQPELRRVEDRYVFTSAENVDPGAAVTLNVHFERSGPDISPTTCLVNGAECRISQ